MPSSIFAGMSNTQLQAALAAAQQAYIDLSSGGKPVTLSYTQGDGTKSVTYTATTILNLTVLIKQLQQALGIIRSVRKPIRPVYR